MRSGLRNFDFRYAPFKQKKTQSIIFTRSQVLVYTNVADGPTFFEKIWFFLTAQEYIYMSRLFLNLLFHPHSDQS